MTLQEFLGLIGNAMTGHSGIDGIFNEYQCVLENNDGTKLIVSDVQFNDDSRKVIIKINEEQ